MRELIGADTGRVDAIADGLGAHSQDLQSLRSIGARTVAELRNAWSGPDFESVAARWERDAGPRLMEASAALSAMAGSLRAHAAEQRRTSGGTVGGVGFPPGTGGCAAFPVAPLVVEPLVVEGSTIKGLDPDDIEVSLQGLLAKDQGQIDTVKDHAKVNITAGEARAEASLVSAGGGNDDAAYEVAAGKVEAGAEYSVDVDAHGDMVASVGVSAAAYLGYASGKVQAGSDFARVGAEATVLVGAEVGADASVSVGLGGVAGRVEAEAFAGAKAEVAAGGTLAGVSASAGAEISYGIGAHAAVEADLSATKVGVAMDIGATLGVGTGVTFDVSVNPAEVMDSVGLGVDELGDLLNW